MGGGRLEYKCGIKYGRFFSMFPFKCKKIYILRWIPLAFNCILVLTLARIPVCKMAL